MKTHKNYTAEDLRKAFYHKQRYKTVFMFLQEQVTKKTLMKRQGTARTYDNAYRRFKDFREDVDLPFKKLTPDMIEQYEAWLINRRLKQNSIRCYLRTLNTLLYKAAEEGLLNNRNLFSHVHLSYVKTTKRAISENELKLIANIRLPENSSIALARDIFMFSFYMRGMPFVDIATGKTFVSSHDTIISSHETVISWHDTTISRHLTELYITIQTLVSRL